MKYILGVVFAGLGLLGKAQNNDEYIPYPQVSWVEVLAGDFSFKDKWSYNENVFTNEFGELVCDGFCTERLNGMRDQNGRIIADSLTVYYRLLDTSHYYHTIQCESSCSEFAGTNFIDVKQVGIDSFFCQTHTTVGTHCSLHISFSRKSIKAGVRLNSIIHGGDHSYECINGVVRVEEQAMKKDILKAEFYLTCWNGVDGDNGEYIYWKGWIYAPVKKQ